MDNSIHVIQQHLSRLEKFPSVRDQLRQLHTIVHQLQQSAQEHQTYQLEIARALHDEYQKYGYKQQAIQTAPYVVGRERTLQRDQENEKRKKAIASGQIRKRGDAPLTRRMRKQKRKMK